MKRFDDAYEKVYDENGMFLFSYYECGIKRGMTGKKKNKLVNGKEAYLFSKEEELKLKQQGII